MNAPLWSRATLVGATVTLLAGCSASSSGPHPSARAATPKPGTGCVTQAEATQVWTVIDNRLNAIELDPQHAGAGAVATGNALQQISAYLQMQLVSQHLTEHEVDRLDKLTVVQAGCDAGALVIDVTMTLVRDDYLKASGQVDHQDSQVGRVLHIEQSYVRSGSAWKESDFLDLDQPAPSQTPQLLSFPAPSPSLAPALAGRPSTCYT